MEHEYSKEFGMLRRVREITELTKIDTQIATANLFEIKNYELIKSDVPSHNLETMAKKTGLTKNEIKQEINVRQHILNWMAEHNLTSLIEVERIIQQYYFDPESILKQMQNTM
jgi:flagellar protein FlaI